MTTNSSRLQGTGTEQLAHWRAVFGLFRLRSWVIAAIGAAITLVLIAIPTAIFDKCRAFFYSGIEAG